MRLHDTPHHQHDCDRCRHLGTIDAFKGTGAPVPVDLYQCADTLIARYSGDGPDYESSDRRLLEGAYTTGSVPLLTAYFLAYGAMPFKHTTTKKD